VLSALGDPDAVIHRRLAALEPAALFSFDPGVSQGERERHVVECWLDQIGAQRPPGRGREEDRGLRVVVSEALVKRGHALLGPVCDGRARAMAGVILMHVGSGGRRKCWPLGAFARVAELLEELGFCPVLMAGPVEIETGLRDELAAFGDMRRITTSDSADLAACIAASRAFVGNDAGPSHLAGLLGVPGAAVFGATSARAWRPLGPVVALQGDVGAPDCWGIEPDFVVKTVLGCLSGIRPIDGWTPEASGAAARIRRRRAVRWRRRMEG
jgi:hypothetical protein